LGSDTTIAGARFNARRGFVLLSVGMAWMVLELAAAAGGLVARRARGLKYEPIEGRSLTAEQRRAVERLVVGDAPYYAVSTTLGWTIVPGGSDRSYRANRQGFRADREYDLAPPAGWLRVAVFGDSFVHGDEVENSETWASYLEDAAPLREVLNFGVGAYGLDQSYLRYREDGRAYEAHLVIIGCIAGDLARSVTTFFPFYSPGSAFPLTKPRFRISGEGIALQPNPLPTALDYERLLAEPALELPRLGTYDVSYQTRWHRVWFDRLPSVRLARTLLQSSPFSESRRLEGRRVELVRSDSEAFEVTVRVLEDFAAEVTADGSIPVVVHFPSLRDLRQLRASGPATYAPLAERLERDGIRQIDLSTAFSAREEDERLEDLFVAPSHWHYVPEVNRFAAAALEAGLEALDLTTLEGLESARTKGND
jgi:hypothetical protein